METPEERITKRIRKERLYFIAIIVYALMILMSAFAYDSGTIRMWESVYQIFVLTAGGLWWWNLIRIEETRAAHERI